MINTPNKILLVAATKPEIEALLPMLPEHRTAVLVTGVGVMHTAALVLRELSATRYACVLHVGIAGAFDTERYPIGTVVEVGRDRLADLGVEHADGSWTDAYDMGLASAEPPYAPDGWLLNPHADGRLGLPVVSGVTVNTVSGHAESIARLRARLQPDLETMEGVACLWACLLAGVPCHQLRGISNRVEPRNRTAWDIPLALCALHRVVERLLPTLAEQYQIRA